MDLQSNDCPHNLVITDVINGYIVCHNCGLVLSDNVYSEEYYKRNNNVDNFKFKNDKNDINEIISRLNLPDKYADLVLNEATKIDKIINQKNINDFLYQTLNNEECSVSIKEIENVSEKKKIKKRKKKNAIDTNKNIVIFKIEGCLEKYCTLLGLNFKEYTVIKEKINNIEVSGHNPLTVIGSVIYKYCKENRKKISMKQISQILNINAISIQRYIKHELSHGT